MVQKLFTQCLVSVHCLHTNPLCSLPLLQHSTLFALHYYVASFISKCKYKRELQYHLMNVPYIAINIAVQVNRWTTAVLPTTTLEWVFIPSLRGPWTDPSVKDPVPPPSDELHCHSPLPLLPPTHSPSPVQPQRPVPAVPWEPSSSGWLPERLEQWHTFLHVHRIIDTDIDINTT